MYYVYFIKSKRSNETYIGSTNNLRRRLFEHNNGMETSTRRYKPWQLVYYEAYILERNAREREKKLKNHGNAVRELKKRIGFLSKKGKGFTQHHLSSKSGAGFTLIELGVVILIMFILVSILIANFPKGKQQFALQREAHKIVQDLRTAQGMSMSGREETCPSSEKANGFGVYFDQSSPNSYRLFANCDGFYSYDAAGDDRVLEDINLEEGIEIVSLSSSLLSIAFDLSNITTYINGSSGIDAQIVISLENDSSKTKTITINRAGLIEIE